MGGLLGLPMSDAHVRKVIDPHSAAGMQNFIFPQHQPHVIAGSFEKRQISRPGMRETAHRLAMLNLVARIPRQGHAERPEDHLHEP